MKKVFKIGQHIWFVLYYNNNKEMYGLEEHDYREGGGLRKNDNETWEELFLKVVLERCGGDDYKKTVLDKANNFLKSDEKEILV